MATTKAKTAAKPVAKKAEAPAAKKAPAFQREMDMKFGIGDLAKKLDLDETYTRAKLRQHGVAKKAKGGTAYGWNTKEDLQAVADKLTSGAKAKTAPANKNDKESAKKAASSQKVPTGMPKPNAKTPVGKVAGAPHAPKDGAIKKVAAEQKAGKAALNKNAKKG